MISVAMSLELRQALQICGGATTSIFPRVEAWLLLDVEHQEALEFVSGRKQMRRYESMVDFLFCEIFPLYKNACFRYYRDGGEQLREMITPPELMFFEQHLLQALEIARTALRERRRMTWEGFRREVLAHAA